MPAQRGHRIHLATSATSRPDLPAWLQAAPGRAIALDPAERFVDMAERFVDMAEFAHEFESVDMAEFAHEFESGPSYAPRRYGGR